MPRTRCLGLLLLIACSCTRTTEQVEPARPLLGPVGLGARVRQDVHEQNDAARERRKQFEELIENK